MEEGFLDNLNLEKASAVKSLIESDIKAARTESGFLSGIIQKYYRQNLPFDPDVFRNIDQQPVATRMAIKNDPTWSRIGRFVNVTDFSEKERQKFASDQEVEKLAIFLLFEKDLDVLDKVFNNPSLPTKVLMDYINVIKERDIDREDDKILRLAQRILKRRSRRIVKARDILSLIKTDLGCDAFLLLTAYLADEDPQIQSAALNAISAATPDLVAEALAMDECLMKIRESNMELSGIQVMEVLRKSAIHVLRIQDTRHLMEDDGHASAGPASAPLLEKLDDLKMRALDDCAENPTDFFNLGVLAYCHMDEKEAVRQKAIGILSVDDILELTGDESTPRNISNEILKYLEKHPDGKIEMLVQEIRLKEADRLNKRMKELEVSVNAYFDVVFQSLGYARINDQKEAVQVLKTSMNFLQQYAHVSESPDTATAATVEAYLRKAVGFFENSINTLYKDTKKEMFTELEEIQGIVRHILDLKTFKFEEESSAASQVVDEATLSKAVMIWRSSISQYLGRIKDLEEMLRIKWTRLVADHEPAKKAEAVESELYEAFAEIEGHHKEDVECKLKIPCRDCKRRGCASERFLIQIDFLISETTENFHN